MVDLESVLGADLMTAGQAAAVIRKLGALKLAAADRRFLFRRWASIVGYVYSEADLAEVMRNAN
jgi:hypothetical protein